MRIFSSSVLMLALAVVHAGEAPDPVATVSGWIKALHTNNLASAWDALPATQRATWSPLVYATQPSAVPGSVQAGRPHYSGETVGLLDLPLNMLVEERQGGQGGRLLAATLASLAVVLNLDGKALPSVLMSTDEPLINFFPHIASGRMLDLVVRGILAQGLETHQLDAIDTWSRAFVTWAASAPLTDVQRAVAAQAHLQAFAAAIRTAHVSPAAASENSVTADVSVGARAVLVAWSNGLPHLKRALALYGLDADAAFASAKVTAEPAAADGSVTIMIRYIAFAGEQTLPLKLVMAHEGWTVSADSKALRWLHRAGMAAMIGRSGFGGPGGQLRRRAPDDVPPTDAPGQTQPVGF